MAQWDNGGRGGEGSRGGGGSGKERVHGTVVVTTAPSSDALPIGADVLLSCRDTVTVAEPSAFSWYHDDALMVEGGVKTKKAEARDRYSMDTSVKGRVTIEIVNAQVEDAGVWRCQVQTSTATKQAVAQLRVGAPTISFITQTVTTNVGSTVNLECNATGEPEPRVSWRRALPGQLLPGGRQRVDGQQLHLSIQSVSQGGTYICDATNALGKASKSLGVNVRHAPFLNPSLSDSQVYGLQTRAVNLTCAWSGFPPPFITWTLNGRSVTRRAKRKYLDGISTLS
ncbi:limbic system-associated membrane protein-like, partial [Diadema antillarum]|uniref:limbic system-associated membrane protein-like n=1 Tax=Diadema antillarum TaxID=105358 RepID=UPI003A8C4E48